MRYNLMENYENKATYGQPKNISDIGSYGGFNPGYGHEMPTLRFTIEYSGRPEDLPKYFAAILKGETGGKYNGNALGNLDEVGCTCNNCPVHSAGYGSKGKGDYNKQLAKPQEPQYKGNARSGTSIDSVIRNYRNKEGSNKYN
jgi:hypothetical protein